MDLLTDLLQQAGLQRKLLDLRRLDTTLALQFPCDKSIGLHVVTHGHIYIHTTTLAEPLALRVGDIALMARGCNHLVSTQASINPEQLVLLAEPWAQQLDLTLANEKSSTVISGAYQFWNAPVHPFFQEMPNWFVLRSDHLPKLGPLALTVALLDEEMRQGHLGADAIVHGLLDVIFTYLLREMVNHLGTAGVSWSSAVADPQVRKAVSLMHNDSGRLWSLEGLASSAGLSRTGLAERFRTAMGDTPLSYLRKLRMQKAMKILSETDKTLIQVALEVGYQDAFSFSKVFKRTVGVAPREFRRKDMEEISSPWRFKSG